MKDQGSRARRVVSYFDRAADGYCERYERDSLGAHGFLARKDVVLRLIEGTAGSALDIGCGPGLMVPDLLERRFHVWGLDASAAMIAHCRGDHGSSPRAHFCLGDATALPFLPESFDVVLCMGVIERLHRRERAVREMHRVLKPGGVCVVTFPNRYSPNEAWRRYVYNPTVDRLKAGWARLRQASAPLPLSSYVTLYREQEAVLLMAERVGRVEEIVYYNHDVLLSPLDQLLPRLSAGLSRRVSGCEASLLQRLGTGFAVRARKAA